ncbi:MAG TPA: MaoC family dehydratase [Streptosporangiaceae bacterium]|nr:MaoC family dehydratase [Streptosporangiaceae bacterium]
MLHYADLTLGFQFLPVEHQATQEVIDQAALAHLDFNPVHTNLPWNERAQVFGMTEPAAHGMFTMSLMTSVIDRAWRHEGASILTIEAKLTKPVPVNQTTRCTGVITELHPLGPGRNAVVVAVTARDGGGDVVGVGTFRVAVPD